MNYRRLIISLALFLTAGALIYLVGGQIQAVYQAQAQGYVVPPPAPSPPIPPSPPINGAPQVLTVTTPDVVSAGFGNVKEQTATASAYLGPTKYFRVGESVTDKVWGASADLLSVLIFQFPYATDFTTGGRLVEKEYYSRFEACVTRTGYYICVTGPDRAKVDALATLLAAK